MNSVGYSWPLEPFDQAHPIRGYFNDPRISGASKAFHFGVDISAPNGTPVYAVAAGKVHLEDPRAISVAAGELDFGYWHVTPDARPEEMLVDDSASATVRQLGEALTELEVNGHFFGHCSLTLVLHGHAQLPVAVEVHDHA